MRNKPIKTLVFSDIGGHFNEFERGLNTHGASLLDLHVPKDVRIIQVGDLVHKGPDSDKLVSSIDEITKKHNKQWIQLAGNHELPYVSTHNRFYPDRISEDSHRRLIEMNYDERLLKAYSITDSKSKDYLITHAGLTFQNFDSMRLPRLVKTSRSVSKILNNSGWSELSKAGVILGHPLNYKAGIFWADCVRELYASWYNSDVIANFSQIHGHTSVYNWSKGEIRNRKYPDWLKENLKKNFNNRHTVFTHSNSRKSMDFYAIDYGLGRKSFVKEIKPLIIE